MKETIAYCITAVIVAIIMAGGLNRAAYYITMAFLNYISHVERHRERERSRQTKNGLK